jgi:hypothetical protein
MKGLKVMVVIAQNSLDPKKEEEKLSLFSFVVQVCS